MLLGDHNLETQTLWFTIVLPVTRAEFMPQCPDHPREKETEIVN